MALALELRWSVNFEMSLGVFNSSKKRMKKFDLSKYYDTFGRIVFIHFLEELKTPKDISKLTDL